MEKKSTGLKHSKIVNDLMSYIYDNIEIDIDVTQFYFEYGIDRFHLCKIFKKQTGKAIYETIKLIRLEKAASILLTNKNLTITEISNTCGYSAQTTFCRAFKTHFKQTPTYWRDGGFKEYSDLILSDLEKQYTTNVSFNDLKRELIKVKSRNAHYHRQAGYSSNYKEIWEKMTAWVYTQNITNYEQLAIYNNDPTLTPLDQCNYVACIVPKDDNIDLTNSSLPVFQIHECLCMTFEIEGTDADILMLIKWVFHEWLPNSEFEKSIISSYMIFENDYSTYKDGLLKGTYYVPVKHTY